MLTLGICITMCQLSFIYSSSLFGAFAVYNYDQSFKTEEAHFIIQQ